MADEKQNKTNSGAGGQSTPPTTPKFQGTPCWNLHFRVKETGSYMPSFKLNGGELPKVGETITITNGKKSQTGVVEHIYNGNCVAITAIKKELPNG